MVACKIAVAAPPRSETLEFLHRLHAFFAHRGEIDKLWRGIASSGRIEGLDIWTGDIENADGFFKPEFLQQRLVVVR